VNAVKRWIDPTLRAIDATVRGIDAMVRGIDAMVRPKPPELQANDVAQYDALAGSWWDPYGPLAMLHWIAAARASLVPVALRPGEVLVDVGCGAGLLAPHVEGKGYRHVGVDLSPSAIAIASEHGVLAIRGDVLELPLPDRCAQVVSAGEILEHVTDLGGAVREACRVLAPGGRLVIDTVAATWLARVLAVRIGEHVPGGAPPGIHDPELFVNRDELIRLCAESGVQLTLNGLRPSFSAMAQWLARRQLAVPMLPTWSTAVLFQGTGVKSP